MGAIAEARPPGGQATVSCGLPAHQQTQTTRDDSLRQAFAPAVDQLPRVFPVRQAARRVRFANAQALTIPRDAGQHTARCVRNRRIACDFSCETRDSCSPMTDAISRKVSSSR